MFEIMSLNTVLENDEILDDVTLTTPKLPINSLSDEVLLNILSYLNPHELHLSGAIVCRKWLHLSRDPSLMKRVILKGDTFGKTEHLVDILRGASMLTELKIRCRDDAVVLVQTIAQFSGRQLRKLQINYCPSLTEECTSMLEKNCVKLKIINLDGTGTISNIATGNLTRLKCLQNIDLFNCKYVAPEHIIDIAINCDFLEHINLGEVTHLNDNCINTLLQLRKGTLKSITLDGEDLTEAAFCNLSHCDQLEEFDLSFAENLGTLVLKEISCLTKLKRLRYSRGKLLTKKDFCDAFSNKNLKGLVNIDFSECTHFDDECIVLVSNICDQLEQVTLDWCENLSDEGIITMIEKCKHIHYLKFVGLYKITDAVLTNIVQSLPKLKYLNLIQCPNITDEILHSMSLNNLTLDIFDYYGNQVNCETIDNETPCDLFR